MLAQAHNVTENLPAIVSYWRPEREWEGGSCVLVANGPTAKRAFTAENGSEAPMERLRPLGFKFITINERYRICPWADIVYFCDLWFWTENKQRDDFKRHSGRKVTLDSGVAKRDPNVALLENFGRGQGIPSLIKAPGGINHGGNSGYQAINLAYHLGVKLILLVGFDMCVVDGKTHDNDRDFLGARIQEDPDRYEKKFAPRFDPLALALKEAGVTVINCTEFDVEGRALSALTAFPVARI